MTCDRCGREADRLLCTGCGSPAHGRCDLDELGLGDVCSECWALLSHVDGVIGCAADCDCETQYAAEIAAAESEVIEPDPGWEERAVERARREGLLPG